MNGKQRGTKHTREAPYKKRREKGEHQEQPAKYTRQQKKRKPTPGFQPVTFLFAPSDTYWEFTYNQPQKRLYATRLQFLLEGCAHSCAAHVPSTPSPSFPLLSAAFLLSARPSHATLWECCALVCGLHRLCYTVVIVVLRGTLRFVCDMKKNV